MGPWNSTSTLAVSYFSSTDGELHYHRTMREVCIIVAGHATLVVSGTGRLVETAAVAIVEPGELHSWRWASPDLRAILIHEPWTEGDTIPIAEV